jgi:hypothetical protein
MPARTAPSIMIFDEGSSMPTLSKGAQVLRRGWSMLVLFGVFCLVISGAIRSEPGRAAAAVLSFGLVVQSWFAQRRYAKSRSTLALLSLILSLPALGSVWLGLNVLRFYSYAPESRAPVYSTAVRLQEIIVNCAIAIGIIVFFWSIAEVAKFLGKAISKRFAGRKKTWWNKPLGTTWMWGSPIGTALCALITSSLLRWILIACSLLGLTFALIFRFTRKDDEI